MNSLSLNTTSKTTRISAEQIRRFAYAYCWYRTRNEDDAREFGQYFVLEYLQKEADIPSDLEPPWHIRNVRFHFLNFLNRHKDNRQVPMAEPAQNLESGNTHSPVQAQQGESDPMGSLQLDELLETIESVRRTFNERDKLVIRLKIQGYSSREIAEFTARQHGKISTKNIDVIYHRFKSNLKQILNSKGFNLSIGE